MEKAFKGNLFHKSFALIIWTLYLNVNLWVSCERFSLSFSAKYHWKINWIFDRRLQTCKNEFDEKFCWHTAGLGMKIQKDPLMTLYRPCSHPSHFKISYINSYKKFKVKFQCLKTIINGKDKIPNWTLVRAIICWCSMKTMNLIWFVTDLILNTLN